MQVVEGKPKRAAKRERQDSLKSYVRSLRRRVGAGQDAYLRCSRKKPIPGSTAVALSWGMEPLNTKHITAGGLLRCTPHK